MRIEYRKPNTDQMQAAKRRCHRCHGSGRAPCQICGGAGKVPRGNDGRGRMQFGRCDGCLGTKTRRCVTCNSEGFI